jgi:hypothetical protein
MDLQAMARYSEDAPGTVSTKIPYQVEAEGTWEKDGRSAASTWEEGGKAKKHYSCTF